MDWTQTILDWIILFKAPLLCLACLILFIITTACLIIGRKKSAFGKTPHPKDLPSCNRSVTIVICARNEYQRLSSLLPAIMNQDYPNFEVIVVNKNSEDDTEVLLASLGHEYPNLHERKLSADTKFGQDTTLALGVGIRAAKMDYILLLRPESLVCNNHWLALIMSRLNDKESIVLSHTAYPLCRPFVRHDLMEQDLHFFSCARKNLAYFCNGNNLVFKKSLFFEHHGFDMRITGRHQCEQALVGSLITRKNTIVCTHPLATVTSSRRFSNDEWKFYRRQQMRTMKLFHTGKYLFLTLDKAFTLAFYLLIAITFFRLIQEGFSQDTLPSLILIGVLLMLRWILLLFWQAGYHRKLNEKQDIFFALIWDMLSPFIHGFYLLSSCLSR